jgi:hypothetical protein
LEVTSLADVAAIDPATDNRLAVRSLRHAARSALGRAATAWEGHSVLSKAAVENTGLCCNGVQETRENWLRLLGERDSLDDVARVAKESLMTVASKVDAEVEFAKACLAKAQDILEAHPEGLPQPALVAVSAYEDDEYDEDED